MAVARRVVPRVRRERRGECINRKRRADATRVQRLAPPFEHVQAPRRVRAPRRVPPRETNRARVRLGVGHSREQSAPAAKLRGAAGILAVARVLHGAGGDTTRGVHRLAHAGHRVCRGTRARRLDGPRGVGAREANALSDNRPRVAKACEANEASRRRRRRARVGSREAFDVPCVPRVRGVHAGRVGGA